MILGTLWIHHWLHGAELHIMKREPVLSNHTTFEGRALVKIICEPCFADYQSPAIGILRNKRSGEDSFRGRVKFLVPLIDVNSCMCNKFLFVLFRFVSFRFAEYRKTRTISYADTHRYLQSASKEGVKVPLVNVVTN